MTALSEVEPRRVSGFFCRLYEFVECVELVFRTERAGGGLGAVLDGKYGQRLVAQSLDRAVGQVDL